MEKETVKPIRFRIVKVRVKEYNNNDKNCRQYVYVRNVTLFNIIPFKHKYIKEIRTYDPKDKNKEKPKLTSYYYYTHVRLFNVPIKQYKCNITNSGELKAIEEKDNSYILKHTIVDKEPESEVEVATVKVNTIPDALLNLDEDTEL